MLSLAGSIRLSSLAGALIGALALAPARAEETPAAPALQEAIAVAPSLEELAERGYRVGEIRLALGEIFDPKHEAADVWLFRMANRLHRKTRPQVVRRLLLFETGDPLSPARIAESERLLRAERIFYDARIVPVRTSDQTVDLEVQTRDIWSLTGGAGFGRSGGVNTTRFEVEDTNFLGLGKDLQFRYQSSVDRDLSYVRYRDRNVGGSRARLDLELAHANDGREKRLVAERPFYSLDTRWGVGVVGYDVTRNESKYRLGKVSGRFGKTWRYGELWGGWSSGQVGDRTRRWLAGWTWDDSDFYRARRRQPRGTIPPDRTLAYLWVGGEWIRDGFVVTRDLDKIERREDLNLGRQATLRFGRSIRELGGTYAEWVVAGSFSDGVRWGSRHLLLGSAALSGRVRDGAATDTLVTGSARYFWNDFAAGRLLVALQLGFARNLDADRQLLLGGDSGLRGYPLRYQQGDRLALLTVEQRVYNDREFFHLIRLGAAGFFDVGRAWSASGPGDNGDVDGVLRDVGIGLRISSSRSSRAAMIHLDVAYPLDGPGDISKVQWLVQTSETF